MAVPYLAGIFTGIATVRVGPTPATEAAALWGFVAGAAAGAVAGLAAAFSGGPLGDGRLAAVGPSGYVNSGLVLRADSEAELAGVMAHEIAHVAARHGTKNATKGQLAQLATIPLIMLGPGGWAGYGLYEGLQFAIPMSFLKFSRDAEREADYLGLNTCTRLVTTRTLL